MKESTHSRPKEDQARRASATKASLVTVSRLIIERLYHSTLLLVSYLNLITE